MIFQETALAGAYVIEPERIMDNRGFFARVWCKQEFSRQGLRSEVLQSNIGFSYRKGTLRGLHFQKPPYAEAKLVRCTRGAMFDVIVDLRAKSTTYRCWFGVELTDQNCKMIYVPQGFAQGYITLMDDTEMNYHTSEGFNPAAAFGVRFDDPAFGIQWPGVVTVISEQDRNWPLLDCDEV
ncbi:MAG: dTDP-4-dehydrorhamnose 3,5-epimerase [Bryobacteraceae bacterium]